MTACLENEGHQLHKLVEGNSIQNNPSRLYIDKYRPACLGEVVGNDNMLSLFKYYLKERTFPNMIIIGPTGSGKNTVVSLFVQEFLGRHYASHCLEIVGSLYRGRCIISQPNDSNKTTEKAVPNISNFLKKAVVPKDLKKVVVVYDFDYTTNETQMSLRRIMETRHHDVRFILSSNSLDNIAETIQSRGNIYRFNLISDTSIYQIIKSIIQKEKLKFSSEVVNELIQCSEGNLRSAINNLQLISYCQDLSIDRLYEILNIPSSKNIERFFQSCFQKEEQEALQIISLMLANGYSIIDLLNLLLKTLIHSKKIDVPHKNQSFEIISRFFLLNETTLSLTNLYHLIYCLLEGVFTD
jgi:DNA polymerase III delta prime subunit